MTALQTTETIYRLFHWKSGTYEFEAGDVEWDRDTVTPLRAESVLMEGFRQVDEWPLIRKRIPSGATTFERLRELEPEAPAGRRGRGGEFANLGPNERRVHDLAVPGRTVEKIVDLSRLGEFEGSKALLSLVNLGYLRAIAPSRRATAATAGAYAQGWPARLRRGAERALATLAIAAVLAALVTWVDRRGLAAGAQGEVGDNAAQRFLARYQLEQLRGALEVYRLERGEYPERLGALVEVGLVSDRDLRYPWAEEYFYRRSAVGRFVLLPPVE
jgi:hypothetical protein